MPECLTTLTSWVALHQLSLGTDVQQPSTKNDWGTHINENMPSVTNSRHNFPHTLVQGMLNLVQQLDLGDDLSW